MLIKNIARTFFKAQSLLNLTTKINLPFSTQRPQFVLHPEIKHSAEINVRAARRSFLKQSVLNHNKIVFWGEPRKLTDRIIPLKNEGKCVGTVKRHGSSVPKGEQAQVDVILQAKLVRGMRKNLNNGLLTVHVRCEDKEYRCILSSIQMHHEGWVQHVVLQQYVPNEPNILTIPIQITHITENPYFQQGSEFEFKRQTIDVICYNEEYPLKFFVDSSFVCPERPYRIGDLANTFPPGLILAPTLNPNDRIFDVMPIEKMQLHLKQKLMKSYLASTKKEKIIGGQPTGGTTAGTAGDKAAGTPAAGGQAAKK